MQSTSFLPTPSFSAIIAAMSTKRCSHCGITKERSEFPRNSSKRDGLYSWCKACTYARNATYIRSKQSGKPKQKRRELKERYIAILGGKCVRCGYDEFSSGLDFHHVGTKQYNVGTLINLVANGKQHEEGELAKEVSECILLCRCCHMALHANEWELV